METKITNRWVKKAIKLINSKRITCIMRRLRSSRTYQVYQTICRLKKKTVYAYGGARTHSLAQQKCTGETLERIALRLSGNFNPRELYAAAGAFSKKKAVERARFELIEKIAFAEFLEKNKDFKPKRKMCVLISENSPPYTYMCISPFRDKGKLMYATGLCTKNSKRPAKQGALEEVIIEREVKKLITYDLRRVQPRRYKIGGLGQIPATQPTARNIALRWYNALKYKIWRIG